MHFEAGFIACSFWSNSQFRAVFDDWTTGFLEDRGSILKLGGTSYNLETRAVPQLSKHPLVWSWENHFSVGSVSRDKSSNTVPPPGKSPADFLTLFMSLCSKPPPVYQYCTSTMSSPTFVFFTVPSIPDIVIRAYVLTDVCSISPVECKFMSAGLYFGYYPLPAFSTVPGTW